MRKLLISVGIFFIFLSLTAFGVHFFTKPAPSELDVLIRSRPYIMSICYKVYANPEIAEGRFWLSKLVLTNKGKGEISDLKVSYRVPDYIDWTTPSTYREILPGQTVVDLFYPEFPSRIIEVRNATPTKLEIKINYFDGKKSVEEIRKVKFEIRGRNEFVYCDLPQEEISDITDLYDNVQLLACLVTPEDPVIKYFTQKLQQKVLRGTLAGVSNTPEEIQRFMRAIYEFQLASGMVYGGTLGLPEKIGNSYTMIQHVRLPREVLTGGAGLCVELSTLFCSIAMSAGLEAGIFVTARHAWPALIVNGNIVPIEATGIGGEGIGGSLSFEKALQVGAKEAQLWMQGGGGDIGPTIAFVNVSQLQAKGLRPPELSDNLNLKKKIDEMFDRIEKGYKRKSTRRANRTTRRRTTNTVPTPAPSPTPAPTYNQGQSITDAYGTIAATVPSGWRYAISPYPQLPFVTLAIGSADNIGAFESYFFQGIFDVGTVISQLQQMLTSYGSQMQYQQAGNQVINGVNYIKLVGVTVNQNGSFAWEGYFTVTSRGVVGFTIGSYNGVTTYHPQLNAIKNSVRVSK